MRGQKCCTKFAPTAHRKEEAQLLNYSDAPFSTRLRSKDKDVQGSQNEHTGLTGSKNQTDKQSRPLRHQHDKSNHHEVKKEKVSTSSANRKTTQPSTDAKKIIDSTSPSMTSRQLTEGPNNRKETESPSMMKHTKKKLAQNWAAQAKSKTSNASSPSQVWRAKEKSARPSEEPAKQSVEESTRPSEEPANQSEEESTGPSEEPDDQSEVEACTHYIRRKGFGEGIQLVGWTCELCERDVGVAPFREEVQRHYPPYWDDFEEEEEEQEDSFLLPEVCVLPCGHVFHSLCLQQVQAEERLSDAPCPFCLSLSL